MSDSERKEIDIMLSLKKWDKYELSYSTVIRYCHKKAAEFKEHATTEGNERKKEKNCAQADLYTFCAKMLKLAQKLGGEFVAIDHVDGIVFSFEFENTDQFYDELRALLQASCIFPADKNTSKRKTFSAKKKKVTA